MCDGVAVSIYGAVVSWFFQLPDWSIGDVIDVEPYSSLENSCASKWIFMVECRDIDFIFFAFTSADIAHGIFSVNFFKVNMTSMQFNQSSLLHFLQKP